MITWFSISSARVCLVSTLRSHLFRSMLCVCVYQFEKRIANVLVILACITATRNPNHHPQSFAVPFTERLFVTNFFFILNRFLWDSMKGIAE